MIKATEVFLKLGRICFQQGARLSSSPAMCTRDSIFHSTPTQHGFGAKPARDGKDILHAPNQCWATVTRPCGTPFETGVFLVEIEFRNSRTRLKVLAEKCRRNRSRGRLQPPGRRETQSGFSLMSLTLCIFAWRTSPGIIFSTTPYFSRIGARFGALGQLGLTDEFQKAIIGLFTLCAPDCTQFSDD